MDIIKYSYVLPKKGICHHPPSTCILPRASKRWMAIRTTIDRPTVPVSFEQPPFADVRGGVQRGAPQRRALAVQDEQQYGSVQGHQDRVLHVGGRRVALLRLVAEHHQQACEVHQRAALAHRPATHRRLLINAAVTMRRRDILNMTISNDGMTGMITPGVGNYDAAVGHYMVTLDPEGHDA